MSPAKTTAKITYTANLVRSSIVPQTMASDTAQNATWKRNLAESGTCVQESPPYTSLTWSGGTAKNQPCVPISALPVPKASAKPTPQKSSAAMARLIRIFAPTLPTFFIREKPTSSIANPACMNNTRTAARITHIVSIASERSAVVGPSCAIASVGRPSTNIRTAVVNEVSLRNSFLPSRLGYLLSEHSLSTGVGRVFSLMYKDGHPREGPCCSGSTRDFRYRASARASGDIDVWSQRFHRLFL